MTIHKTLSSVHISFARVSSCLYVCALSSFFLERLRAFIRRGFEFYVFFAVVVWV